LKVNINIVHYFVIPVSNTVDTDSQGRKQLKIRKDNEHKNQ